MTDEEIEKRFGPDPRTFDRSYRDPRCGRPFSEASPENYQAAHEFFCWFSDFAQGYPHCPLTACKRHRRCTGPRMADCLDIFHPGSYPGMLIRNGMPLCIAMVWDVIGPEFMKMVEQSIADDVAKGHK